MNKRKILVLTMALSMVAILAAGATLAYFTDTDSAVNTFTVGNVEITQLEQQRAKQDGVYTTSLTDFVQDQKMMPGVWFDDSALQPAMSKEDNDYIVFPNVSTTGYAGMWKDELMKNEMDKVVSVYNSGNNDAYVRTIIALPQIPCAGDTYPNAGMHGGLRYNNCSTGWSYDVFSAATVNGKPYTLLVATFVNDYTKGVYDGNIGLLSPAEYTHPSLLQIVLDNDVTAEEVAPFLNADGKLEVLCVTQAVQADGFTVTSADDVKTVLNEAFGEISSTNHPWAD